MSEFAEKVPGWVGRSLIPEVERTDIVQRAATLEAWLGSYVSDDSLTLSG